MAHFAKVENGIVTQVIVADQEFIDSGAVGSPNLWLKTSYNTIGGTYFDGSTKNADVKEPLRKNFAGVGYTYDKKLDAFIPPKPFESFVLNKETCLWEPPIPYPDDGKKYLWNEESGKWVERVLG